VRDRWDQLEWMDKFGYVVMAVFVIILVTLTVGITVNEDPSAPSVTVLETTTTLRPSA